MKKVQKDYSEKEKVATYGILLGNFINEVHKRGLTPFIIVENKTSFPFKIDFSTEFNLKTKTGRLLITLLK